MCFFSHQYILLYCVFITIFVLLIFIFIFRVSYNSVYFSDFLLEFYWTFLPLLIVALLFVPLFFFSYSNLSFSLCYLIVANQWFWDHFDYETSNSFLCDFTFVFTNSLNVFNFSDFVLTSNDVLHAFSLPYLFMMVDLVPGVIHNLSIYFPLSGLYTVYCAQICGSLHSNMYLYFCVN